jgi:hypothetical protein
MRRWVMPVLAVACLLMLVALPFIWWRSVRYNDELIYRTSGEACYTMMTVPHGLCFQRSQLPALPTASQIVILDSNPPAGWSFHTWNWGTNVITSGPPRRGPGMLSAQLTITLNRSWYPPANSALGFGWDRSGAKMRFVMPLWFVALACAILPALWIRNVTRSRHRHRHGLCPSCGYDLRATPGRCPECGREIRDDFQPAPQAVESADQ